MNHEPENPFSDEFGDVTPLEQDKVNLRPSTELSAESSSIRQRAALFHSQVDNNFLIDTEVLNVGPLETLEYKIDGIQHGVFKNLKRGSYSIQDSLDLHRMTVAEARTAVFQFVQRAIRHESRCILITHGKGERSSPPARIKSFVNQWLKQFPEIVAFCSALPKQGGVGAVYVLLKKSESQKQENRERFNR